MMITSVSLASQSHQSDEAKIVTPPCLFGFLHLQLFLIRLDLIFFSEFSGGETASVERRVIVIDEHDNVCLPIKEEEPGDDDYLCKTTGKL